MAKKTRMLALKIDEISAVDRPAQEGATVMIMKRAGEPDYDPKNKDPKKRGSAKPTELVTTEKGAALTDNVKGHSHLIIGNSDNSGFTSHETSTGDDDEFGHRHPWVRLADGTMVIGMADGHVHDLIDFNTMKAFTEDEVKGLCNSDEKVAQSTIKSLLQRLGLNGTGELAAYAFNKVSEEAAGDGGGETSQKETKMSEKNDDQTVDHTAALEKMQADLAMAKAYGELSDIEKVHYAGLDDIEKAAFLGMASGERTAHIETLRAEKAATQEVVFTAKDGSVYTKSDDPRIVAMAKSNDELRAQNVTLVSAGNDVRLEKAAESDYKYLPGTLATRVALIKSVEGIADEAVRTDALTALKAQSDALGKAFVSYGNTGSVNPEKAIGKANAEDGLNDGAKAYHKSHPDLTEAKAYDQFTQTPEGRKLYNEHFAQTSGPSVH